MSEPGHSQSPYGYRRVRNALVEHPTEYPILQRIIALPLEGMSQRDIANTLGCERVYARNGKTFEQSTISSILRRHFGKNHRAYRGPNVWDQATGDLWDQGQR